jgi:hypothetical protein
MFVMKHQPSPYITRLLVGPEVAAALPTIEDRMADCYCELYNARGRHEWGEDWTRETALQQIHKALRLDGEARVPILHLMLDAEDPELVVGFLFGAILRDVEALDGYGFPDPEAEGLASGILDDLVAHLDRTSTFPICSLPEWGILRPYRGGYRPNADLIVPLLEVAKQRGCRHSLAWSSVGKKSNVLLQAFGGRIFELGGDKQLLSVRNHIATVILLVRVALVLGPLFMKLSLMFRRVKGIRD